MAPLLNEEYLNVVKVLSVSMAIEVSKAILISLTAISSSCDILVCTFLVFKSMQWNACAFENLEQMELKNQKQNNIRSFFRF